MATSTQELENTRVSTERTELAERIRGLVKEEGALDLFPGVAVTRATRMLPPYYAMAKPAFCVIAQGSKRVMVGEEEFTYDPGHYLLSTVDLPVTSCVIEASDEAPYLGFRLDLEPSLVASVMIDEGLDVKRFEPTAKAVNVGEINADMLNAVVRILRLAERPEEVSALLPMIQREIVYRLLKSAQGARLAHLVASSEDRRISKAVSILRESFDKPLSMETLARNIGMSVSGFHQHFKSVTSLTPLQYQKQIRLQEARRLMLGEDLDAASAGFRVGYDDPSYFSRDYKKHFGSPPQTDIARLRSDLSA
jgi:AraC-like DNA-binding protein